MPDQKPDIVKVLRFWSGRDDVPEELWEHLSTAADEIAHLRMSIANVEAALKKHDIAF